MGLSSFKVRKVKVKGPGILVLYLVLWQCVWTQLHLDEVNGQTPAIPQKNEPKVLRASTNLLSNSLKNVSPFRACTLMQEMQLIESI